MLTIVLSHNQVLDVLEECVRGSTYEEVYREKRFVETSILSGRYDHPTLTPDLWAKYQRKKRYDIYQIWDHEGYGGAAYEVIRSVTTPNIRSVSIVTLDKDSSSWNAKYAKKFVSGIFELLEKKKLRLKPKSFYYANLDSDSLSSRTKVKRTLITKLDL